MIHDLYGHVHLFRKKHISVLEVYSEQNYSPHFNEFVLYKLYKRLYHDKINERKCQCR